MSALEQIRKRPAITIGIIGFALILFLFTGINGCDRVLGGDRETAAKVNGHKITINQLQAAAESQRQNDADGNVSTATAMQQLIDRQLVDDAIAKLGIRVTNDEIAALIYGQTALPYFTNMAQQYGFNSMDELYAYANSGDQGAEMAQQVIDQAIDMIRTDLPGMKFQNLLGAINVNKLDAKAYYDANAQTATIYLARQDYNTVPDDAVTVTDDQIRDRYNATKSLYALNQPTTSLSYLRFDIVPSPDDYMAVQSDVEGVLAALKSTPGLEAIEGNYNYTTKTLKGSADKLDDNLVKTNLDTIKAREVALLRAGNNYAIAKLLSTETASESAKVRFFQATDPAADLDSIVALLNSGVPADSISLIVSNSAEPQPLDLINSPMAYLIQGIAAGQYAPVADTSGNKAIAYVAEYDDPAAIYEIALIERPVEASNATYASYLDRATAYIAAHPKADTFGEGDPEAGIQIYTTTVTPDRLDVLNLPHSAGAARWAAETKKGTVSDIFTDDDHSYILVLAVDDRYDDYIPVTNSDVANAIRSRLIAEAKGAKLMADLKDRGNDVDSYAAAMGSTPETVTANYGSEYVRGFIPGDPYILAAVKAAKQGEFVGPLATRNSVVVFRVDNIDNSPREFDYTTDRQTVMQREPQMLLRNLNTILRQDADIDYDLQRFYND